jgi:tetratricopeptide (TPR) repeat protein
MPNIWASLNVPFIHFLLQFFPNSNNYIRPLGISPDSQTLVSCGSTLVSRGSTDKISIWNLRSGNLLKSFKGFPTSHCTLISLDGSTLVMCNLDEIGLWSLPSGNHLKTLKEFDINPMISGVTCPLAVSPDAQVLALASSYNDIRLWNLPSQNISLSIALITNQEIAKIEVQIKDSTIEEDFRIILEFILTLINLRRNINNPIKIKNSSISTTKLYAEEKNQVTKSYTTQSKSAEVLFNIGNTKFLSGDIEGALANFSESIKLDPNNPNCFFNRATTKYHLGDKKGAINDYSEAIKINPQYFDAWYGRGVIKFELWDFKGALVDHNEAIKINPEFANAYFGRGNAKRALGDKEGASIDHNRGFRLQRISH